MTRRSLRPLLLAAAACLAGNAALAADPARVAVLPVVIHSIEEAGYLREGIAEMLASRLGQQGGLSVVKVTDAAVATVDADAARAAASAVGANWVLFGSFTRFGEGASLDLRCVPVAGDAENPRSVFVQAGNLSEVIPRLDGVVERIATHVRGGAPPPIAGAPDGSNLNDVLSDLESLRQRVESLEARLPAPQANAAGGASATN
jgi:outer membrane protein insertion porin family